MRHFRSATNQHASPNHELAHRFFKEVCDSLGETFILGTAFQSRYRMLLYEEPRLMRRMQWSGALRRVLDFCFSFTLAVVGINVALLRGPWLLRKYGIHTRITSLQYLIALAVFSATPYFIPLWTWPRLWLIPLLAWCLCCFLLRLRPASVAHAREAALLAKLWIPHGITVEATVAPGLVSYYLYMRLIGTIAWVAGQHKFTTACIEELAVILDHSETFDLAEECLIIASERMARSVASDFDITRLEIRTASLAVTTGQLKKAAALLENIPSFPIKDDETRRWSAFKDLTKARLHQERFAFEKALRSLENARQALRLRLSGVPIPNKAKARLTQLFAHAAEQKILILSLLSRFDEAAESARADSIVVANYGDSLRTVHFEALRAYIQAISGTPCSSTELSLFEQALAGAERTLPHDACQNIPESDRSIARDAAQSHNSTRSLLRLFSGNQYLLAKVIETHEFQRSTIVVAALFARCQQSERSLRCLDMLGKIRLEGVLMQLNTVPIFRAIALAMGGRYEEAAEIALHSSETEVLPLFGKVVRAVLRGAIEWESGRLYSAKIALQDVHEHVLEIGLHYAAIDVRAALVLIDGNLLMKSGDITLFLALLGPVLFLWNIGMGLMETAQGSRNDGATHVIRGLEWLEDRRVFIETPQSVVGFKKRYGWIYDLAIVSSLDQGRFTEALRLSERLRCMTLLVLNHYHILNPEEVLNIELWRNYQRIQDHIRELLDIAERKRSSVDRDAWTKFLKIHFNEWLPETVKAELLHLASELDLAEARLRREHPNFRRLQARLLLHRDPVPFLEGQRAILYYLFDSSARLWIFVVRSEQRVNCVLALASQDELEAWIKEYVEMLQDSRSTWADISVKGSLLGRILIERGADYLHGVSEICIVPHGNLFSLPFHALVVEQQYAVCQWSFSYLPALSFQWLASSLTQNLTRSMLAVVDPETEDFAPLENSDEELNVLRRHFEVEVQRGAKATKRAFCEAAPDFAFMHFTAHAEADDRLGLASYIRLAGSNHSDCRLRPQDIVSLHLDCILCNLSSCKSGVLAITELGEIESLATSFLVAGTRHVVAALWNVKDQFAPKLTDLFYSGPFLEQPALALSMAQRHWARQHPCVGSEQFAHPVFWAPFYAVERFDFGLTYKPTNA